MNKVITLVLLPLSFMFLHALFPDGKKKVDVFLFKQHEEQIRWIAHDMNIYLTNVVLMFAVYLLVKKHSSKAYSNVTFALVIFAVFRLVEYFTFRGTIPMLPIVLGIVLYSFRSMYNGVKNNNS